MEYELTEEMRFAEIQDRVARAAKTDGWVQECKARMEELEPAYQAIRGMLTPEQQELLDDYIAACEELEYSHIYVAYQLGREKL